MTKLIVAVIDIAVSLFLVQRAVAAQFTRRYRPAWADYSH